MKKTGQVEGKGTITVERGSRGEREPGKELEQGKGRERGREHEKQEVAKLLSRVTDGRAKSQ